MTHSQAGTAASSSIHAAFILRLSWDSSAQQWCILVKPTADDDARLFGELEAAFLHVEMLMAAQMQRPGMLTTAPWCTSGEQLQETNR